MIKWPVLRQFDQNHVDKIALPVGGIGTGTISLGGRGDFRDCECMNTPNKGNQGCQPFFCIHVMGETGQPFTKLLEGPFPVSQIEGPYGAIATNHGLPRFRHVAFKAAYPFGQVELSEKNAPVDVTMQVFNPLIPTDVEASSFPAAVIRYNVRNLTARTLTVSVCGTATNCTGTDHETQHRTNRLNVSQGLTGLRFTSVPDHQKNPDQDGEFILATPDDYSITTRETWLDKRWNVPLLDFWDDFTQDGKLEPRQASTANPKGSICLQTALRPNENLDFTFILAWRFPNRRTWTEIHTDQTQQGDPNLIGNRYCHRFKTPWDAAAELNARLPELEQRTLDFVTEFIHSPAPDAIKDAALSNLSTLRTQTCFQTPDGNFYGWEGCGDKRGSCFGSCTHVWNYEQTTPFLFGKIAQNMRRTEFLKETDQEGLMSFRVKLPLDRETFGCAAADGQMGCVMKAYREWKLSGDNSFLKELWPKIKAALKFAWVPKGWDGDQDGVMEGCQHNTMDVEYYGPNPQMQAWYLGALKAAEIMAREMNDLNFAQECQQKFQNGKAFMDDKLFNGDYYEQIVMPPKSLDNIHPGLQVGMGSKDLVEPEAQLGKACLVDQLVGDYVAHIIDLPPILDQEHVRKTLKSIYKYNRKNGFWDHFNNMRSFVAQDEQALLMASYPHGHRPKVPFPYFTEVMTGFEYTAAVGMIYQGLRNEGLTVIQNIRDRYDGAKRSPFNEAECGHHYARAMAAWAAYLAWTGFHFDAVTGNMTLKVEDGAWFWSTGYAFGTCTVSPAAVAFHVSEGIVNLNQLTVGDRTFHVGETLSGRTTIRL